MAPNGKLCILRSVNKTLSDPCPCKNINRTVSHGFMFRPRCKRVDHWSEIVLEVDNILTILLCYLFPSSLSELRKCFHKLLGKCILRELCILLNRYLVNLM